MKSVKFVPLLLATLVPVLARAAETSGSPKNHLASSASPLPEPAQHAKTENPEVERYVWDLSSLYADWAAWEAERTTIKSKLQVVGKLRGTLGRSPQTLADGLDQVSDLRARAAKMAVYGVLVTSADTRSETAQMQYDVGTALESQVESAVAFIRDEILNLGAKRLNEWFRQEPRLERHRIRINRVLSEAPHSLPEAQQSIVASMARWPQLSGDAYWALHDSDVGWPTFQDSEGKQAIFNVYAYRSVGEKSARAKFLERLHGLENAFALLLARRIDADLTIARHRKFHDGAEAYWFLRDGMPPGTQRVMIDVARKNLATAHRYFQLRARALNRDRVSYADFYDPAPGVSRSFSISDTMEIAVAASAPLGPEYQQRLRQRFQARWMHLPSWPNKRVSGEVYPPVGGANPYFIMGYLPTLPKARAFAGCVTLMMSDAEIPRDRVPDTRDDPATYQNCVIYIGEFLFDDYLAAHPQNRQERIAYLVNSLDLMWNQYLRWVLASELDARVQELIKDGRTPTGAEISKIYLGLLRDYVGGEDKVDTAFGTEWITYSIPFESYEYQFWPPAIGAAASIMDGMKVGKIDVNKAVTGVFGRGDSDRSYQLFQQLGINLSDPDVYEAVIRRMNRRLDELESLLNHTK
jgi:oligoendopeptidase F